MIEKIFYVAEDGTKFETKDECVYYEKIQKSEGRSSPSFTKT